MIGCPCDTCRSADPRDKRSRPSIYIEAPGGPSVLVDTSTDLRQQALAHNVSRVDAILFTHSHADHVMGLDDVRRFNMIQRGPIPAYADARTAADLRRTFSYVFNPPDQEGGGVPQIELYTIDGAVDLGRLQVQPVPIWHGQRSILGFRCGSLAYLTDCNRIPEASFDLLHGLDVLVLDALRHRPHPTHYSVSQACEVVARVRPERAFFTHICHDLPHAATNAALPPRIELAYDGLTLDVEV